MNVLSNRISLLCSWCQTGIHLRLTQRGLSAAAQPLVQVDFLEGKPHRKHPGVTNLKTVRLPEELQCGALSVIQRAGISALAERTHALTNYLWSRKRAVEDAQLREKAFALEKEIFVKERELKPDLDEQRLEAQVKKRVLAELRRTTYRWTPLKYDEDLGVVYMAARLAGGYAAVKRALNEIKKRDPSFAPNSLLDFGSGVGTTLWVSHAFWGDSLKESVCVDSSAAMNSLAEQLLKGGNEEGDPLIKQVYFRQFLPVSPKVQSDLVVSAFTLSELATLAERMETVFTLWRKTNGYLVLVENGTKEGYQILMEAREALLQTQEKVTYDLRRPAVFGPCTHELLCPKLLKQPTVPCNFLQAYNPLPLQGNPERQLEKFSYLILSRAEPVNRSREKDEQREGRTDDGERKALDWARLIGPVLRRPRHVQCQLCGPDGELKQVAVTTSHHGRDMYRCARSSDWGDRLPIIHAEEDSQSDHPDEPL